MSGMDRLTELLPCPFCGGEADTMTPEADDMRAATVMCMGCYCTGKECETEAQAIAAWNRRASQAAPAPSDGLREAVEAERERIAVALETEADILPCAEDAAVTRSNAALIRADFSYEDADRAALTSAPAQEGGE